MTGTFANSNYGKMLGSLAHARRPTVGFMGESLGIRVAQAMQYACSKIYHADIILDNRLFSSGGNMFATGGTDTNHLLNTQLPWWLQRPTDIVTIANGYNDTGTLAAVSTTRILQVAQTCLANGAMAVIIFNNTPFGGSSTADAMRGIQMNTILRNACSNIRGLYYVDVTSLLVDATLASPNFKYRAGAAGTFASLNTDGTHWSATAMRLIAPQIATILQQFCPERRPRAQFASGLYDPVNYPYGNLIGDSGNMMGTAGTGYTSGFDTGVPGISASNRLNTAQQGMASVTLTNSIVQDPTDGHNMLRITFSGTCGGSPAVNVSTTLSFGTVANNNDSTRYMTTEAEIRLNSVVGFLEPQIRPLGSTTYSNISLSQSAGDCDVYPDNTSENLFIYTTIPQAVPAITNPGFAISLTFRNTGTISGSIDIGRFGAFLIQ